MFIAELSILVSFLCFVFLFIRKIYPVITDELDSYIEKVREQISSAEKLQKESEAVLKNANELSKSTKKELENYKKLSQEKLLRLEEENKIYLEELRKKSEAAMNVQLQAELSRQKKILTDKLSDLICEKLSEKLKNQNEKIEFSKEDLKKLL